MLFLFIYSTHILKIELNFMSLQINYKNISVKKNPANLVLFVDDNFSLRGIKKYISVKEYAYISDLLTSIDKNKKIVSYDIFNFIT